MNAESTMVLRWSLLIVIAYLLQVGFLQDIRPFGVHPEIMLLLAICGGLVGGSARGAIVGFCAGILNDLLLSGSLGVSALCFALVGFAAGVLEDAVIRSSRLISMAIATVGSAVGILMYACLSQLLGAHSLSDPRLWLIISIVSVVNGVLCLAALPLCRWAEGLGLKSQAY
ncbi:MAG: rod shape-determining protein MreD [Actinomycetes bacterium]